MSYCCCTGITYQIGYRLTGQGGYTVPYTDLPCGDYYPEANKLLKQLRADFPQAEWRLVEVRR